MHCPNNHGEMLLENNKQDITFRNESFSINVEQYRCSKCGFEGGSLEQISKLQSLLSDAYRKKVGISLGQSKGGSLGNTTLVAKH